MNLVIPLHFISWKNSFSDISRKCIWPNMNGAVTAPIIFGQMHFLLKSENEFFHEIKCNGRTSFMEFMMCVMQKAKQWSLGHSIWSYFQTNLPVLMLEFYIHIQINITVSHITWHLHPIYCNIADHLTFYPFRRTLVIVMLRFCLSQIKTHTIWFARLTILLGFVTLIKVF